MVRYLKPNIFSITLIFRNISSRYLTRFKVILFSESFILYKNNNVYFLELQNTILLLLLGQKYAAFVDRLGIYHVDKAVPDFIEMHLSLLSEFWD